MVGRGDDVVRRAQRDQAERLLGMALPTGVTDAYAYAWRPNEDLPYVSAYVKLRATHAAFDELVGRLGMYVRESGALETLLYLPATWQAPTGVHLTWWDPSGDTPADSAAGQFGVNGHVVAKYEDGCVYAIATDIGHEQGTPGPW
jgi:hypothetical protein